MSYLERHLTEALAVQAAIDDPTFDLDGVWSAAGERGEGLRELWAAAAGWFDLDHRDGGMSWRRGWLVAACALVLAGLGLVAMLGIVGSEPVEVATSPNDPPAGPDPATAGDEAGAEHDQPPLPVEGCAGGPAVVPERASVGDVVDVDGDGVADRAWIRTRDDGSTEVGIVTAAGGGASRTFESASPVSRSVLVVDADQRGPVEILASDGRSVQLWAFDGCEIVDVTNIQGDVYTFSLGFGPIGTGVGCVDTSSGRRLVGLDVTSDDGTTVQWSRTVVNLDGTGARNGPVDTGTFTRPDDDPAIDLLHQVACGDLTMAADGISTQPR